MISHELRNPLSAVIQCAELVISGLQQLLIKPSNASPNKSISTDFHEEMNSCLDVLQTIVSCSMYQKRVIDDVLTLSKLDSDLIIITPVRIQPTLVVADAIKMFVVECQQMDRRHQVHERTTDSKYYGQARRFVGAPFCHPALDIIH